MADGSPPEIAVAEARDLRVLHVLRAPLGGLFRHVCDLAAGQRLAGFKVGVVIGDEPQDPVSIARLRELAADCELGVHIMPMNRTPGLGDAANLIRMVARVRLLEVDVIHGHGAKGGAYARLLPRFAGAVRLYTPHGGTLHFDSRSIKGQLFFAAERFMRRRTDGFVFESEFGLRTFVEKIGKPTAPSVVVHNGVTEADCATVLPEVGAANFVFVGELRELKGIGTLIKAMRRLGKPAHLRIVGSGAERATFEAMARLVPSHIRIKFMGAMPARDAFALGRVVVLPSHHESLPYVALEAAAAGLPLIATRVGGLPEVFGPDAAELVAPADPDALAAALSRAIEQPQAIASLAGRLRTRVQTEFSASRMVKDISEFYRAVLEQHLIAHPQDGTGASITRLPESIPS